MKKVLNFFSLFGSLSTLLCCALPVTLVSLGMGATFASLTATFPQITWLTGYKNELFVLTGIMLLGSYYLMKKSETQACPIDQNQREACQSSKSTSKYIFWASVFLYIIGLSFSFIIPRIIYGM